LFQVEYKSDINTIFLCGNFDASRAEEVKEVFDRIENSVRVDMSGLDFICSAGIGLMVMAYRKLKERGEDFYLVNLNEHINKVFKLSLLDKIFKIQ
jgi:anti-sigma B factor antagonist